MNENGSVHKRTEVKRLLSNNKHSQPSHGNDDVHIILQKNIIFQTKKTFQHYFSNNIISNSQPKTKIQTHVHQPPYEWVHWIPGGGATPPQAPPPPTRGGPGGNPPPGALYKWRPRQAALKTPPTCERRTLVASQPPPNTNASKHQFNK